MGEAILAPRLFASDGDVRHIAEGLLARTLPRAEWTHEAHLAAIVAILMEHPDIVAEDAMPAIISGYNLAAGGVNDDTQGYHETMTMLWIAVARAHIAASRCLPLVEMANSLIAGPNGGRELPLRYYSRARLFSVEARRAFVPPDLAQFDFA